MKKKLDEIRALRAHARVIIRKVLSNRIIIQVFARAISFLHQHTKYTISYFPSSLLLYSIKLLDITQVHYEDIFFQIYFPIGEFRNKILRKGCHEPAVTRLLFDILGKEDVFWDVGAHWGYYAILAAQKIVYGKNIHVFEPNPLTLSICKYNLKANGIEAKVNELYLCETTDMKKNISGDHYKSKVNQYPDVIKIDIEGGEIDALKGMDKTVRENYPLLFIEVHPKQIQLISNEDHRFIHKYLSSIDYSIAQLVNFRFPNWNIKNIKNISDLPNTDNYMLLAYTDKHIEKLSRYKNKMSFNQSI